MSNVEEFPDKRRNSDFANGNGGNSDVRERLAKLEAQVEHLATKADIKSMENSLIKWMMGTIAVSALTLIVAVIRTLN